ncbi:MAG: GDP-mannose 4,6-dehydratase [candidate division Zixibacteria bacterium CG_4_9_14_3_um_filter_46_8]|nr:MAG: GDP-mannose 4,6-dehydratase [candidate division Zixibacteria bacterium CG_4_9_14_3_um_filter_46_8]
MRALVSGITGQDGYYLAKFLLEQGYEIHGIVRRNSQKTYGVWDGDEQGKKLIHFYYGDVTDKTSLDSIYREVKPNMVFHLAAQSFVQESWSNPEVTYDVNIKGTLNMLNSFREYTPEGKFYFACSSEIYGKVQDEIQSESSRMWPRSPYGISKLAAFWTCINYRESYNLFVCNGILFNHESPFRGIEFVTRKISLAAAKIKLGLENHLKLGNLDAKRDWGFSGDYVRAMYLMLQQDNPDDYVIATGETHSVGEFAEAAFRSVGLDYRNYVTTDPKYIRPAEVQYLRGDASKARRILGWEPKVKFNELVKMMVEADLGRFSKR